MLTTPDNLLFLHLFDDDPPGWAAPWAFPGWRWGWPACSSQGPPCPFWRLEWQNNHPDWDLTRTQETVLLFWWKKCHGNCKSWQAVTTLHVIWQAGRRELRGPQGQALAAQGWPTHPSRRAQQTRRGWLGPTKSPGNVIAMKQAWGQARKSIRRPGLRSETLIARQGHSDRDGTRVWPGRAVGSWRLSLLWHCWGTGWWPWGTDTGSWAGWGSPEGWHGVLGRACQCKKGPGSVEPVVPCSGTGPRWPRRKVQVY